MFNFKEEEQYNKEILKIMCDSYFESKLIPFIGAGFSKNALSTYPEWTELIENISQKHFANKYFLKEKFPGTEYLVRSADYASVKFTIGSSFNKRIKDKKNTIKTKLFGMIKTELQEAEKKANGKFNLNVHKKLVSLKNFNLFFTTNWDDLLEKACDEKNISYKKASTTLDLSNQLTNKDKYIVKMHGCLNEDSENIVVTETDYFQLVSNRNHPLNVKFFNELFHRDILCLGFSFNDPNILNLAFPAFLEKSNSDYNEYQEPKIFLVSFSEYDPIIAKLFIELRGVYILFLDVPNTEKTNTIRSLLDYISYYHKNERPRNDESHKIFSVINKSCTKCNSNRAKELENNLIETELKLEMYKTKLGDPKYNKIKNIKYYLEEKINFLEHKHGCIMDKYEQIKILMEDK
ncbi:MAG: SIR2 family protein [Rhodothermaceae bacterium]